MYIKETLILLVIFFANVVEAVSGFAGTMLAMPFAIVLVGIKEAKVILNVVAVFVSLSIAVKNYHNIEKKEVLKICILMLPGMALGLFLFSLLPIKVLSIIYGIFIILVAIRGLTVKKEIVFPGWLLIAVIVCAGIIHGLFLSGGALLVLYAVTILKDKSVIRATLAPVWLILNLMILVRDVVINNFTLHIILLLPICLSAAALALFFGNKLHKRINQNSFVKLTYILLIISGVVLLV